MVMPPAVDRSTSAATVTVPLVVVADPAAPKVILLSASRLIFPDVVVMVSFTPMFEAPPFASSSTCPVAAVIPDCPAVTVIVPAASIFTVPAPTWLMLVIPTPSVSFISMFPEAFETSRFASVVSMLPRVPTPVAAFTTRVPAEAFTSTKVSPPSTIPPFPEVRFMFTAPVVTREPMVISSSAFMVTVPLPALMTVPSFNVAAPLVPVAAPSLSAVTVTAPLPELTSPVIPKITSSSAINWIVPPADETGLLTVRVPPPDAVTETALAPAVPIPVPATVTVIPAVFVTPIVPDTLTCIVSMLRRKPPVWSKRMLPVPVVILVIVDATVKAV